VGTETLTHHIFRANEVGFEHKLFRNTCSCLFALLLEPQVLHLESDVCISSTLIYIVIKIMLPRSHSPQSESETWLPRSNQAFDIVRERNYSGSHL
jgi:hypothetical protein